MFAKTHVTRRILAFFLWFSVLPLLFSLTSSVLYRGGGLRASSTDALALLAWRADPGFVLSQVTGLALGLIAWSMLLSLGSLAAWRGSDGRTFLRAGRFTLLVWLVAVVSYPGMSAWVPVFRALPSTLNILLLLIAVSVAYAWPGARAKLREWLFAVAALSLIFWSPGPMAHNLERLTNRAFTARDVFIIGYDSVTAADTFAVLERFQPKHGHKTLFTDARTTYPATSVAWRSILSGQYPPAEAAIPGMRWGADRAGWLPAELRAAGYDVSIAQDMPEANWFWPSEDVRVVGYQGWKVAWQSYVWKAGFPLTSVGANWWVGLFGGPSTSVGRPAHCARCFVWDSLGKIARAAARGPVLGAIHTCEVHGPNRLSLGEALRVPGWWRLPATFFLGKDAWASDQRSRAARMDTLRRDLQSTLEFLDEQGVLGRATVFVLADHGPRGAEVPFAQTRSVMLAMFTSAGQGSSVVSTPVSLVDLAPTIRLIVGLPKAKTDGRPLPDSDGGGEPSRLVRTDRAPAGGLLGSMGLGQRSLRPAELGRLGHLLPDGTIEYDSGLLSKVREISTR